jgi:ribosomal-protein-alanine N-acetyltransferase
MRRIEQIRALVLNPGKSVELRALKEADAASLVAIRGDERVMKWVDGDLLVEVDLAINWIREQISDEDKYRWAIVKKDNGQLIGTIGVYHLDQRHGFAHIGFELGTDFQSSGFMQEAIKLLADQLFKNDVIYRLEAQVHEENRASQHLLEKCGFRNEGRMRKNFMIAGALSDSALYAKLWTDE